MARERVDTFNPFPLATWIAWLGATVVAAVTMVAFAYTNFETKESARDHQGNLTQRLDRMETKVDRLETKIDEIRAHQ